MLIQFSVENFRTFKERATLSLIASNYDKDTRGTENIISKNNLRGLTKVRIFDILWWSYLKAKKLRQDEKINWSTVK